MEFEKSGISYILEKDEYESDDLFYKRAWYIANKMPETDIDLEKQIKLSKLWANHKFNSCVYSDHIMNEIS